MSACVIACMREQTLGSVCVCMTARKCECLGCFTLLMFWCAAHVCTAIFMHVGVHMCAYAVWRCAGMHEHSLCCLMLAVILHRFAVATERL